ncbi:MAG: FMN-binding negative transcriptional regulator [Ginsengibacter sp.]
MYKFKYFTEDDNERVITFMKENPFATIVAMGDKYPAATHVPLDIIQTSDVNNKLFFTGHIMKNSDHHKAFLKNENVLVIFNGPHCHVSASWYPSPVQASTWNYMTVHAKGRISFGDEAQTKKIVEALTNKYEPPESNAAFNKLPNEYVDQLVKAIIAFSIEVESFDNVFKLSQNHDEKTRESIIMHLNKNGNSNERAIAAEMQQRINIPKQSK